MTAMTESSDSARSARPLRFAETVVLPEPLPLRGGGTLPEVRVTYECYGSLNEARDNAVLICHALTGDSHVARHTEDDDPGWWDAVVGPGEPVDTERFFVLCSNVLGSCRGTTGPNSVDPRTGERYGPEFPLVTIEDMVEAQRRLVDALGIERLLAVVGGSMGGHQALAWAALYPERVAGVVPMATAPRLSSQALAFDIVARNAVLRDPDFADGHYYDAPRRPASGLAIARMIGHITYLSPQSMDRKFDADRLQPRPVDTAFETHFSVGSYLGYQGDKFVARFDANSYVALTRAIDRCDFGETREALCERFRKSTNAWLLIGFSTDWLYPPRQMQALVEALIACNDKPVSACTVESECGHDAFLLPNDLPVYGELLRGFLGGLLERGDGKSDDGRRIEPLAKGTGPTARFHGRTARNRSDFDILADLIEPGESVLDLGCGQGDLLALLRRRGLAEVTGVEIDEKAVVGCVAKGLPVVQADLNLGLPMFLDKQFDVVVLSRTLQTIVEVERVVRELIRVGRKAIVSFPNFGFRPIRERLMHEGRIGRRLGAFGADWHNTKDLRTLTIRDFEEFCEARNIAIDSRRAFDTTEQFREITESPNENADLAVFVIRNAAGNPGCGCQ